MPAERRRRAHLRFDLHDLLTEMMQSLLILTTLAIPVEYFAPDYRIQMYGLFLFALAATAWIRVTALRVWQFLLLNVTVIVLPLVLPILPAFTDNLWPRLILVASLVLIVFRAFYLRLRQNQEQSLSNPSQQALVILYLLALNLAAIRLGLTIVSQAYFYVGIVYLMMALARWHRLALASQLERFVNMPTQPADRIMRFNRILLLGYALLTLFLLVISPWLHIHDLLPLLGSALLAVLRWFFGLFRSGEPEPTEPVPEPTAPSGPQDPNLPFEPTETARWIEILQQIFYYIMIGVVVAVILALIGFVLYSLYRRFYETAEPDTDQTESLRPSLVEQTKEQLRHVRKRLRVSFGKSPAQRIRQLYQRLIETQIHRGLTFDKSKTPRELLDELDLERFPQLASMTYLYEKARYGPGDCSLTDVQKMQNEYRGIKKQNVRKPKTWPPKNEGRKKQTG